MSRRPFLLMTCKKLRFPTPSSSSLLKNYSKLNCVDLTYPPLYLPLILVLVSVYYYHYYYYCAYRKQKFFSLYLLLSFPRLLSLCSSLCLSLSRLLSLCSSLQTVVSLLVPPSPFPPVSQLSSQLCLLAVVLYTLLSSLCFSPSGVFFFFCFGV